MIISSIEYVVLTFVGVHSAGRCYELALDTPLDLMPHPVDGSGVALTGG